MAKLQRKITDSAAELTIGLSEYALGFETLDIQASTLISALGEDHGDHASPWSHATEAVLGAVADRVQIRVGFRVFAESAMMLDESGMRLDGARFETGNVVGPALQSVSSVALFAVTGGLGLDRWLAEAERDDGKTLVPIVTALGRTVVARAAAWVEQRVSEVARVAGYDTTSRYYPGSCGWQACDKGRLFALLPPRFCGILVNEAGDTMPSRSVVGVIGIGRNAVKHSYPCSACTFKDCFKLNGWA